MTNKTLIKLFNRDLNALSNEIAAYKKEENLWLLSGEINNTGGNLALHIIGNLNHFIGAILGNTGYLRKRDLEFSHKNIEREEILQLIYKTRDMVESVLSNLNSNDLKKTYPINVFKEEMTTEYFLTHLTTHLSYHLGQINYHRRLLDI